MRAVSTWVARRFADGFEDPHNMSARSKVGLIEGWVSIALNTVMAVAKGILGVMSGSVALLTDAVHTFADSGTSLVVILGFQAARKPADQQHPFGHGRIESIASLIIGILLGVTAFEMGKSAVERILTPQPVDAPFWMILLVLLMLIAKELMARFSMQLGQLIDSDALQADAWHHRSDVFATGLVIVAFVASKWGANWLDGVAGFGVALLIGWAAIAIVRQASQPLIGEHAPDSMYRRISELARTVEGVLSVHEIIVQQYGARSVISLHVEVPRGIPVEEAHDIATQVEQRIDSDLGAHVTVHADPSRRPHPETDRIEDLLRSVISELPHCSEVHDLEVVEADGQIQIDFDVSTTLELAPDIRTQYTQKVRDRILAEIPRAQVSLEFDPPFCHDGDRPADSSETT